MIRNAVIGGLAAYLLSSTAALAQPTPVAPVDVVAVSSVEARANALYAREWAWRKAEFAEIQDGPRSIPGDHLASVTPAAQARRAAYWTRALAELDAIPVAGLSGEGRINAAVFRASIAAEISNIKFRSYEAPLNSDTFFWGEIKPYASFSTAADYRRYLGRLRDVPRYFDENIANMRTGLARGYSVPRVGLIGRDTTIVPFTKDDAKNPLMEVFARMPDSIPAAEQAALRSEAQTIVTTIAAPAYAKVLSFMRSEYMPRTRTTTAAYDLPDGKAFYQARIDEYTTLELTPEQIHQIGLEEVARIDADMHKTMLDAGFKGSFAEFLAFLRKDPQFYAKTPKELLGFSALVTKRMDGKLKDTFGTLPRYRFTILPVPDAIAPIYTSGRGGLEACLMNTYDLPSRPLYALTALTLHECEPGHSFQAALALEAPKRPAFRRETYFSGYGEGWGLYTEWLGSKIGMYETPYEEFGRETFEMWRAVRLVIDTGIHAQGWSRQRAIDYLASHTALAQHDIEIEVDRYISWPAQALAYKLGEMHIRKLRALAESELGARFDQRPFHDKLLSLGSVPLPVMDAEMTAFIAAEKAKPATATP